MQGNSVSVPTGSSALSAIDTGTTLIGGPSNAVQAIYSAIPGAQPLGGQMEGFFAFRKLMFAILDPLSIFIPWSRSLLHQGRHLFGLWWKAVARKRCRHEPGHGFPWHVPRRNLRLVPWL